MMIPIDGHPGFVLVAASPSSFEVRHGSEVLGCVEHFDQERSAFSVVLGWAAVVGGQRLNSRPLNRSQAAARVMQAAAILP